MEFFIEKQGVFKKEKKMRGKEWIRNYGDVKEMLEGDFYKPETPASPFFRSESSTMKIKNKTGLTKNFTFLRIKEKQSLFLHKNFFRSDC